MSLTSALGKKKVAINVDDKSEKSNAFKCRIIEECEKVFVKENWLKDPKDLGNVRKRYVSNSYKIPFDIFPNAFQLSFIDIFIKRWIWKLFGYEAENRN